MEDDRTEADLHILERQRSRKSNASVVPDAFRRSLGLRSPTLPQSVVDGGTGGVGRA
jgi:hypothetical protein